MKRATSATIRSTAAWAEASGISSRRDASTSIDADRVISGERSSWLTSDAKRLSLLDALLEHLGHVVERGDQHAEVGVVGGAEPGVEAAAGDGLGGHRHVGERAQGAAAGPPADGGAGEGGDEGGAEQRGRQRLEGALGVGERHELEVEAVDVGQRDADQQLGLAVDRRPACGPACPPRPSARSESGMASSSNAVLWLVQRPYASRTSGARRASRCRAS